ncbi:hypothetical protein LPB90_13630 [Chryseobacterium sp. LC2016-29]|uniref:hypothetical protein n=1 Tax=Chryseobacterium sp. LC2016-29 TaxID=2897331 RepID=UPI001E4F0437|nr:hypothetical protein [Chryseobacterium sp. LC2016-29]MCD0479498.1 hypothetical protein [Chryseobacterium sp. LC2016-29]
MDKKQKKISTKISDFDWVGGISEYDYLNIAHPTKGPYELDAGFDVIYGFEKLKKIVASYQDKFEIEIAKLIDRKDLSKINNGIKSYVDSSVKNTEELSLLKASLLASHEGIITELFEKSDEGIKQFYGQNYFEDIKEFLKIDKDLLIKSESINKYRKLATNYTINCISEFHKEMFDPNCGHNFDEYEFYDREVFRGFGNFRYYENKAKKNFPDMLSKFTSIDSPMLFIERQIFNSYTLSERLAERFMTQKENQRRAIVTSYFKVAVSNLFTSFVVNNSFKIEQYELLCLPMTKENYIFEIMNDKISAEFFINDSKERPDRLERKIVK